MSEQSKSPPDVASDHAYFNVSHAEAAEAHDKAARSREPEDGWVAMEATGRTPETHPDIQDEIDNAWSFADEATDGDHGLVSTEHHLAIAAAHRRAADAEVTP